MTGDFFLGGGGGNLHLRVAKCPDEVFTAVQIQVAVFCFMTPCSVDVGYKHFSPATLPPPSG
jgi:hypothetical protein